MRQGKVVATTDPQAVSADALARLMIGRSMPHAERSGSPPAPGEAQLVVEDLSTVPTEPHIVPLDHVTLTAKAREIVGIAGVSGNGQEELVRLLSGEVQLTELLAQRLRLGSTAIGELDAFARRQLGLAYVPAERLGRGAVGSLSLALNALLTGPLDKLVTHGFTALLPSKNLPVRSLQSTTCAAAARRRKPTASRAATYKSSSSGERLSSAPRC